MPGAPTDARRYLAGNFAPVGEERTVCDLPVEGVLPDELTGRYLRNGPNPAGPVDPATHHWFTGHGMVHGVRLRDGRAEWYRNRWVRTPDTSSALDEEPRPHDLAADRPVTAANTNVVGHAGRIHALVEAGAVPVELTDELETVGPSDLGGTLPGAFSAHPKRDPVTGELHVCAYWWAWGDRIQYLVVGTDGRVRRTVDLEVPGQPMVHDLAITDRRAVLFDLPVTFDLDAVAAGSRLPYRWNPDYGARVGLLPFDGDAADVVWCEVEPCYVYHPVNAHELGDGRVVVDVIRYARMFHDDLHGPGDVRPTLDRWTIDPWTRRVHEARLDDRSQELPRLDERRLGRAHRYAYSVAFGDEHTEGVSFGPLYRHDLHRGTTAVHDPGPGREAGEPVFVPAERGRSEDDGWLLSLVYDRARDASELVVLAAADFTAAPVARVLLPDRVPYGFHGNWIPDGA